MAKKAMLRSFETCKIYGLIEGNWFLITMSTFQYVMTCFLVKIYENNHIDRR